MDLSDTYSFNTQKQGQLQFMSIQEALDKYRVETHSKIIPYVVRDHAWNFGHHDQTNFYRYREDAPAGYKDAVEYRSPHPTNVPVPPKVIVDIKEKEEVDDHLDEKEEAIKNGTYNATTWQWKGQVDAKSNVTAQTNASSNVTAQLDTKSNATLHQGDKKVEVEAKKEVTKPAPKVAKLVDKAAE
jgi:hypothetical protein